MAEDYSKLKGLGKESFEVLTKAKELVKPGAKFIDVAKGVEDLVESKGLRFAFPINISINAQAAHYTPAFEDKSVFETNDVVKIDLGLRNEGDLTDCALTVDLSSNFSKLVEATEEALGNAMSVVKAGRKLSEIGREVESVAKKYGFLPIKNLGGHGMSEGELHSGFFIPNFDNGDTEELKEGDYIAVEVFLTNGFGSVEEGTFVEIFRKLGDATTRSNDLREVSDYINTEYGTYSFALRWLIEKFKSEFKVRAALNELARQEALETFPVLVEKRNGMVAQAEKSLMVEKDSCTIIT
jgi:methionyl aminopeptidase